MPDDAPPVRRPTRASIRRVLARPLAAALLVVASLWCAPGARAQDAASTRRVAEETLRHGFQTNLPGRESRTAQEESSRDTSRPEEPTRRSPEPSRSSAPAADTSIPESVGWTLAVIGAALVLVWIGTAVHAARSGGGASPTTTASTPPAATTTRVAERAAPGPADDGTAAAALAEAAAGDGRFDEAAHELLIAALASLVARGRLAPDAALTSREAADVARVGEPPRADLRVLVAVVERSRFGSGAVDAATYAECSAAFGRVAAAARSPG